jgi:hypothetical protein
VVESVQAFNTEMTKTNEVFAMLSVALKELQNEIRANMCWPFSVINRMASRNRDEETLALLDDIALYFPKVWLRKV